jgi:hypothetical protein
LRIVEGYVFYPSTGSLPTRLMAVSDKWVQPIKKLADLTVDPTDLICDPKDLQE